MTFEITWTPQLRAEAKRHRRSDTFGGFEWFPKPTKLLGAEIVAEIEWLLGNGATPWEAAASLGRTQAGLEIICRRQNRKDLANKIALTWAEKQAA